jgi:hypothetical protein
MPIFGFKIFGEGLIGDNGYKFEVGKTYTPADYLLDRGSTISSFVFSEFPLDIYHQYKDTPVNPEYALIEALGKITHNIYEYTTFTDKIKIVKKISRDEMLEYLVDGEFKTHSGDIFYLKNKQLHREDNLPAVYRINQKYIAYYYNGMLHRDPDIGPAEIIYEADTKQESWYKHGKLHRNNDLPAVRIIKYDSMDKKTNKWLYETIIGESWYQDGELHRSIDGYTKNDYTNYILSNYAKIDSNGDKYWYKYGKLHRDHDLPAIIRKNGTKIWYQNGLKHRSMDAPAVQTFEANEYYVNGLLHRYNDLPAIDGSCIKAWYKHGKLWRSDTEDPVIIRIDNEYKYYEYLNQSYGMCCDYKTGKIVRRYVINIDN